MRKKTVKGAREIRETIERIEPMEQSRPANALERKNNLCLLYTSDAADE